MITSDLKTDQDSIFIYSPIPRDRDRSPRENSKLGMYEIYLILVSYLLSLPCIMLLGCVKNNDCFCYLTFLKNSYEWLETVLKHNLSSAANS